MGIIGENCFKCSKDEDKKAFPTEPIIKPQKNQIQPIMEVDSSALFKDDSENSINEKLKKNKTMKSSMFIFTNQFHKSPSVSYEVESEINPTLKIVTLKNTNKKRLMKIINGKNYMNDEMKKMGFESDIKYLQSLEHTNINKIYESYIHDNIYYLICDYNGEKNLIEQIKNKGLEEESTIYPIMNQLFNSIIYLHNKDIFNIELRLNKIVIIEFIIKKKKKTLLRKGKKSKKNIDDNKDKEEKEKEEIERKINVLVSVWGYLKENYSSEPEYLIYYPPEVIEQIETKNIKKNYGEEDKDKADEWACGIIMYYLITGKFPFNGKEKEEIYSNIKNKEIDFSSPKFESIPHSKDLISKLLEKDMAKRISIGKCLEHSFFSEENLKKEEIDLELLKNLLKIKKPKSKFHELINAYLCLNFLDKNEEKKLSEVFKYIDKDNNNSITEDDIKNTFNKNNIEYNEEQIKNILYVFDYNRNNSIQYQEFLRVLCDKKDLYKEENIKSVFNAIDIDKNNYINIEDIQKFVPNDDETKSKIEKEFTKPFGMQNEDKMIYEQFYEIIRENKTYDEVNNNFKNQYKKVKLMQLKSGLEIEKKEEEK